MNPSEGYQYYRVTGTAAGTTVITNQTSNLHSISVGVTKTGSATFYDSATAAGTSSANYLIAVDNNGTPPGQSKVINARLINGLVVITSGTTDLLVTYK